MNGIVRHLWMVTLSASCFAASAIAQSTPAAMEATFVSYGCRYKSCDQVAAVLRPLLPEASRDPNVQLVVDREGNRLLLSGPAYVHNIAKRLIGEVDRQAV